MKTVELSWTDFKADIIDKGFPLNYRKNSYDVDPLKYGYEVFVVDRGLIYWVSNIIDSTEVTDFETNYKTDANKNLTYDERGYTLESSVCEETQVFTNEAIRNTNVYTSATVENKGYKVKTIIIHSTLDQAFTMSFQASRDATNWFNVCDPFVISANIITFQTCEAYFPYNRCTVQCSVSPTTGNLNVWCEKMGA